jgi:hypothetical protein
LGVQNKIRFYGDYDPYFTDLQDLKTEGVIRRADYKFSELAEKMPPTTGWLKL